MKTLLITSLSLALFTALSPVYAATTHTADYADCISQASKNGAKLYYGFSFDNQLSQAVNLDFSHVAYQPSPGAYTAVGVKKWYPCDLSLQTFNHPYLASKKPTGYFATASGDDTGNDGTFEGGADKFAFLVTTQYAQHAMFSGYLSSERGGLGIIDDIQDSKPLSRIAGDTSLSFGATQETTTSGKNAEGEKIPINRYQFSVSGNAPDIKATQGVSVAITQIGLNTATKENIYRGTITSATFLMQFNTNLNQNFDPERAGTQQLPTQFSTVFLPYTIKVTFSGNHPPLEGTLTPVTGGMIKSNQDTNNSVSFKLNNANFFFESLGAPTSINVTQQLSSGTKSIYTWPSQAHPTSPIKTKLWKVTANADSLTNDANYLPNLTLATEGASSDIPVFDNFMNQAHLHFIFKYNNSSDGCTAIIGKVVTNFNCNQTNDGAAYGTLFHPELTWLYQGLYFTDSKSGSNTPDQFITNLEPLPSKTGPALNPSYLGMSLIAGPYVSQPNSANAEGIYYLNAGYTNLVAPANGPVTPTQGTLGYGFAIPGFKTSIPSNSEVKINVIPKQISGNYALSYTENDAASLTVNPANTPQIKITSTQTSTSYQPKVYLNTLGKGCYWGKPNCFDSFQNGIIYSNWLPTNMPNNHAAPVVALETGYFPIVYSQAQKASGQNNTAMGIQLLGGGVGSYASGNTLSLAKSNTLMSRLGYTTYPGTYPTLDKTSVAATLVDTNGFVYAQPQFSSGQ